MLERFADAEVLVIDDHPANVALLRAVLERGGLRGVRAYTDPREAVARLSVGRPDLILVDLHMPHLDGYAVLERINDLAAGSYLPALVLTADASPEALQRALSAGARDFLTKPFDATEVLLRVRNLLETNDLHKTLRHSNAWLREIVGDYRATEQAERGELRTQKGRVEQVLREESITMLYQPVAEVATGAIVGLEALARFAGEPRRGPDVWFAEAERVGLGVELELLAARTAFAALPLLPPSMFLAVNISPAVLVDSQHRLLELVDPALMDRLVLELTEHVPVENYDALVSAFELFRKQGARLALDDTGAGYAGFRHLLGLKPEVVKLDLSLTRGIDHDPARRALARALVHFSRDIDAALIAEGVETVHELATLAELGVPWAQGYYLARPQPLADALAAGAAASARGGPSGQELNLPGPRGPVQ